MTLKSLWSRRARSASEWFVRLQESPRSRSASDEFIRWLNENPEHERDFEDRELAWELSTDLRGHASLDAFLREAEGAMDSVDSGAGKRRPPQSSGYRWTIGAAALLVCVVAAVVTFRLVNRVQWTEYSTARGEQRQVTLPDGSSVFLNTATHLKSEFSRSGRVIDLDAGEALFSVAKDPRRPFVVRAVQGQTTAIGTQFAVRVRENRAEVTVLEGVVRVKTSSTGSDIGTTVAAGQALDYSAAGDLSALRPANRQRIDAWKVRRILFDDTPLSEAIEEYNLYGSLPIVVKSVKAGERHVHGVFRIGDEPSFIRALEQGLPIKAVQTAQEIDLLDK